MGISGLESFENNLFQTNHQLANQTVEPRRVMCETHLECPFKRVRSLRTVRTYSQMIGKRFKQLFFNSFLIVSNTVRAVIKPPTHLLEFVWILNFKIALAIGRRLIYVTQSFWNKETVEHFTAARSITRRQIHGFQFSETQKFIGLLKRFQTEAVWNSQKLVSN